MVRKRKTYDTAFKRQAVELTIGRKNLSQLARELGVQRQLLYRWRKEYDTLGDVNTSNWPPNSSVNIAPTGFDCIIEPLDSFKSLKTAYPETLKI